MINGIDQHFIELNNPEYNELGGFFSKITSAFKKVGKSIEKIAKKALPVLSVVAPTAVIGTKAFIEARKAGVLPAAAALVPGIGTALGPLLSATSQGSVGAIASTLLSQTPVGPNVLSTISNIIGPDALKSISAIKGDVQSAFNSVVSPDLQKQISVAVTKLKMAGQNDTQIVGEMLRSDLFKSIATKINTVVQSGVIQDAMTKAGIPKDVAKKEAARKAPIIAAAAAENVAQKAPGSFDIKKIAPFLPLVVMALRG